MAKIDKELEEITTTDKLKAFKVLKDAGYRVEMAGSGVPTIICTSADEMEKAIKDVKKILKDMSYVGSFGVRAIRKSDMISNEPEESKEVKTEEVQAMTA